MKMDFEGPNAMRQKGEASVEEILDSIKKVIARDNRAGAAITRQKREADGISQSAIDPADADEAEEILDLAAEDMVETGSEDDLNDDFGSESGDEYLTTDGARDTMRENLAALAMLAQPGVPPQIVRTGETSLEGMVREMLRPMLADWLDNNLPDMVEKMVKDEISRIAGKRS